MGLLILAVASVISITGGLISFYGGPEKQEIGSLLVFLGFVIFVPGFVLHTRAVFEALRLKREKEIQG